MIYYIIVVDGVITQKGYAKKLIGDAIPITTEQYSTLKLSDNYEV